MFVSPLQGFLDVGEPIVIGTSNPDLFSSGENEILLILRGEDGSVVTRQMLTITASKLNQVTVENMACGDVFLICLQLNVYTLLIMMESISPAPEI